MPNGTYGGVRGRKMKVGGNDYIIFLLLDSKNGLFVIFLLCLNNEVNKSLSLTKNVFFKIYSIDI